MSDHGSVGELIDLRSPVSWKTKPEVFTPLIPVPVNQNIIPCSPADSNPFDIVAAQTSVLPCPDDPFELIFSTATSTVKNDIFLPKIDIAEKPKSNDMVKNKNESNCMSKIISPLVRNIGDFEFCLPNKSEEVNKPSGVGVVSSALTYNDNFVPAKSEESAASNTTQFNSEIESIGSLNKAHFYSDISSIQGASNTSQDSDPDDSVFTQGEFNFNDIAKEAEKVARMLSESTSKFSQSDFPNDIEDIMSCEPSWVCDSSDDEVDSLRKDPALNLRINFSGMSQSFLEIKKSLEDSDALKRFKSIKKRRSLGIQTDDDDDITDGIQSENEKSLRRSQSLGSRLQEYNPPRTSGILATKQLPVALVKPEENINSKLKSRKPLMSVERKPLKALIPLQNMARGFIQNKEKLAPYLKDVSPTHKNAIFQPRKQGTPVKRIQSSSLKPVASSTPTLSNKRHSFGNKVESGTHKSRSQFTHFGSAARRSSSANSGIPTPISLR